MIPTGQEQRRCGCGRPAVTISLLEKVLEASNPTKWFCTACAKREAELIVMIGKTIMEQERDSAKLAG